MKFQDIKSVFWRNFGGVGIPDLQDVNQQKIAFNDSMSLLRSLMKVCSARWVNSWQAYQFHKEKPLQLLQVKYLGIKIPATLVTNNPEQVQEFTQSHQQVISKPVYGGAYARSVTKPQLDFERISSALRLAPVTLQEYIPGTNIRTYAIAFFPLAPKRSHFLH
ncbi:hypothetical protein [Pleurocapsa sp. PCC 7319]|uniref:hypothetical protein n=1 Tax=Pleurocapsa sp. PCC 7319 TaxID=118161 RepID=UPI00034C2292|nr:hypothetical protein [Pleurocapsa sp. PCC 7319]